MDEGPGSMTGAGGEAAVNPLVGAVGAPPVALGAAWGAAYDGRSGPLIDCSQAVPSHPPPALLAQGLARAAQAPATARYGPILGDPAFRAAYAAHQSAFYGTEVAPSRIAVAAGCNQAFFVAVLALAGAGDAVLLPTPWYFNHQMTLAMLGIEARPLATAPADGFLVDPRAVAAALDAPGGARVRALVVVSPNNPTGAVHPAERLHALFALCADRGIALILDETYRDFLAPGSGPPHALFADRRAGAHLVGLYSFSKAYAIPGQRLGAITAGEERLAQIVKVIDCVQICAPRTPQAALGEEGMFERLRPFREETARAILGRGGRFRAAIAAAPGWDLLQLGAYFAYVRHPFRGVCARAVAEALAERAGILALPGPFFGPEQEDFLRVAFANVGDEAIAEIGRRLALFDMG